MAESSFFTLKGGLQKDWTTHIDIQDSNPHCGFGDHGATIPGTIHRPSSRHSLKVPCTLSTSTLANTIPFESKKLYNSFSHITTSASASLLQLFVALPLSLLQQGGLTDNCVA